MSEPVKQPSFAGGEISPFLYARTDLSRYDISVKTLRNFIPMRHGGATNRPGTMYVGTTLNNGAAVRLIPFIFNETGDGQSYVLEFGNLYVAFYQDGGVVSAVPPTPYTIASPYLQADLQDLKFAQSADIITITHPSYLPMELQRLSSTSWILAPVAFQPQIPTPTLLTDTGGDATIPKTYYAVSCVAQNGEEGFPVISAFTLTGGATAASPVTLTWAGIGTSGATSFRVYKSAGASPDTFGYIGTATGPPVSTVVNMYTFHDPGIDADFTNAPPVAFNPFVSPLSPVISSTGIVCLPGLARTYAYAITAVIGGVEGPPVYLYTTDTTAPSAVNDHYYFSIKVPPNTATFRVYRNDGVGGTLYGRIFTAQTNPNVSDIGSISPNFAINPPVPDADYNPSNVGFSQQRRCFSNTIANPVGFWMSQTGLYSNFNTHIIPQDSDSVFGSLAGQGVNEIEHILELKFMLFLTAGAEIYVQGNGSGVVTPSEVNASQQSQYGASALAPLRVGDLLLFNQSLGSFIRDFAFDFAIDGYRGNDITIFAAHLFEGYEIVDWGYQKIPDSIIWAVRNDGVLLSCTYVREQQVLAWAVHEFTNGTVENVCCIPENGQYATYLVISRVINGSTVRYLERMSSRIWTDPLTATYLDCFGSYDGRNTTSTTMNLYPDTSFETDDLAYRQHLNLEASTSFFTSDMVGNQIFIQNDEFVDSQGQAGDQIRLTIQSISSATLAIVTPNRAVPIELQGATDNWSYAVDEVSGLDFLEGMEVSVWADRFLVGSPLNTNVTTVYTVTNGAITLDKCYAVIYVGLPMVSDLQPLDIETAAGPTLLGKRKLTGKLNFFMYNTRSFFMGSENPDTNPDNSADDALYQLTEQMNESNRRTYDQPPDLRNGQDFMSFVTQWNYGGQVFLRCVDPIPVTILAIAPEGMDSAPNASYKKV